MSSPLLIVLGPTASGKSELALLLAETFGGEIVGCDSVQVYRGLDIGSAKLSLEERRGIHHYLIDVIDPDQELTAGAYSRLARQALAAIKQRGRLPIVVGGTGLYLRALLDGLSPAPARDSSLRERLRQLAGRRPESLHRFLRRYDPPAAARIHPRDHQKLIRAIELTVLARQSASDVQARPRDALAGFAPLKLGLAPDRSLLYQRLNQRCAGMFARGLLAETEALRAAWGAKPLKSLGYKQAVEHLAGFLTCDQAVAECQTKTRQYAKRQLTWFRREPGVHWLMGFGSDPAIQKEAVAVTRQFLAAREGRSV